mmetsp:Transcript_22571/g.38216  ORF Transcript_22571/g.38216 Transcript_22571/m.38216 type:complete len:338 (-) Transcript_22571:248-1261(-)
MNTTNVPTTVRAEPFEIDLMDEFDCNESNEGQNSLVVAEEFNNLITEFDNTGIVEDISVLTSVPATATAVYVPSSIPPTIQVAETSPGLDVQRNHSLDDGDEMLVEAIEIISCENTFQDNMYTYNDATQEGSQFVEYSTDPFESKNAISDVNMLHDKMDAFMSDNNMFDSNEFLEDDDIEVFASMMQTIEQEYVHQTSEQVENKQIMQAMIVSNQQHVQEVNAYQQQEEEIAVQIGPICTAPFGSDTPQFSMGSTTDSTSSQHGSSKKKCSKKKKDKKGGFGAQNEEEYEGQKNILRQEATAKRKRTAGKFAKRKIEWMSITEAMQNNQSNADDSKS